LKESYENPWSKGKVRPEEWNQKQRETVAKLMESGNWTTNYRKHYQGVFTTEGIDTKCRRCNPLFRSSYELAVHLYCEENKDIEWYDYEPFSIPYDDVHGIKRSYRPDFIIKKKSCNQIYIIEVKSDFASKRALNISKHQSTEKYAESFGFIYELWLDDRIKNLGYNLKDILQHERVLLFK
jgi:hypothetical protein